MGRLGQLLDQFQGRRDEPEPAEAPVVDPAEERARTLRAITELARRTLADEDEVRDVLRRLVVADDLVLRRELVTRLGGLVARQQRRSAGTLVLADQRLAAPFAPAVSLRDVVRDAARQSRDPARVEGVIADRVVVRGRAAAPVTQLLAEVIDNSLACAAAPATTLVGGHTIQDGYVVVVQDCGSGLTDGEVDDLNARMRAGVTGGPTGDGGLGLAIVQRVARRHDIEVRFDSQPGVGTTVEVVVPSLLLESTVASVDADPSIPASAGHRPS